MRRTISLIVASTFLTAAPAVFTPQVVEAREAGLFQTLFPRAAERRRQKRLRRYEQQLRAQEAWERAERQRRAAIRRKRAAAVKTKKVESAKYYTYVAQAAKPVKFTALASSFDKAAKAAAAVAVAKSAALTEQAVMDLRFSLDAVAEMDLRNGEEMRLANGADLLGQMEVAAQSDVAKAVIAHYRAAPEFMWIDADGEPTEAAEELIAYLAAADSVGLNAADYRVKGADALGDPLTTASVAPVDINDTRLARAMQFEFALTTAALRYALDARHGTVNPDKISGYHDFKANKRKPNETLAAIAAAPEPARFLADAHPRDAAFGALVKELAALDDAAPGPAPIIIPNGTFVRPGQTNAALDQIVEGIRRKASEELLTKHAATFALPPVDGVYSNEVAALVRDFQKAQGLGPDGIIGKNTIRAIVGTQPKNKREQVLMAMERLRWHPDELGSTHVFINQPAYTATYMTGGKPKLAMRAIVGKKANQTNFFHDTIEYVEFNPYWGVPRSILVNEMLPKLRQNAGYLDNKGYEISTAGGRPISSWNVDWWSVGANFPYNVRQPPGPKNALGELKIMFPNKHSIYMHDTPSRNLFSRDARALSHGCVRLADPRAMAAAVLETTREHVSGKIAAGRNARQNVKTKIPVYVAYFTAWPEADGTVRYFGDIYGRDAALAKAMATTRAARAKSLAI
ncbi:MAG: L,D-transpeptidase family protein [Pseudomonadota bacterium]